MENILRHRSLWHRSYLRMLFAITGLALAPGAWADTYTDALNSEAAEASVDAQSLEATPDTDKAHSSSPETATATGNPAINGDLSGVTQNQFEDMLKVKKRGSFLWYSRLETEQKSQVYQDFLAGTDLETLGKTILKLFTQRK